MNAALAGRLLAEFTGTYAGIAPPRHPAFIAAQHVGGAIGADIPEVLLVSPRAVAEMGLDLAAT